MQTRPTLAVVLTYQHLVKPTSIPQFFALQNRISISWLILLFHANFVEGILAGPGGRANKASNANFCGRFCPCALLPAKTKRNEHTKPHLGRPKVLVNGSSRSAANKGCQRGERYARISDQKNHAIRRTKHGNSDCIHTGIVHLSSPQYVA